MPEYAVSRNQRHHDLDSIQYFTSGTATSRRALIRWLNYTIVIPYELEDYRAVKLDNETYSEENPIREANDLAFRASIVSLFQTLSPWGEETRGITLTINVIGRQQGLEPGTKEGENLMQLESVPNGEQWVVFPYRARFPEDDASMLPRISCVEELIYDEYFNFWPGAALQVAAHCDFLNHLRLFIEELEEEEENLPDWQLSRNKLHHEKFHRLFISLGLAAR
ncbi:hypothetical protein BJX68DRAFT_268780 [Aspergillus pseudodeflectus]|uniref:Uncharacterized protein n=1 Tax=Aspergillus pseudodeflectus TaxID=176178 RepID=A0ABR4K3H9_9EURO